MTSVAGKRCISTVLLVGLFLLVLFGMASAQEQRPNIALKATASKETKVLRQGKWVVEHVPVEKAVKGDTLLYAIAYTNEGRAPATDAAIIDAIPSGMVYVVGSAAGKDAEITCSIDGGKTFHKPPLKRKVRRPDGTEEDRLVPQEMYTHIRWVIHRTVQPGMGGTVFFKTTVR